MLHSTVLTPNVCSTLVQTLLPLIIATHAVVAQASLGCEPWTPSTKQWYTLIIESHFFSGFLIYIQRDSLEEADTQKWAMPSWASFVIPSTV